MSFNRQVSRTLDEEHRASLDLLTRLERAFAQREPAAGELAKLGAQLAHQIEDETHRHFAMRMPADDSAIPALAKVPQVTLLFWAIKIAATTLIKVHLNSTIAETSGALGRGGFERVRRFWRMRIDLEGYDAAEPELPPGVGPLKHGDLLEIAVPEIGTLRATVAASA